MDKKLPGMTCPVCGEGELQERADMTHVIKAGRRTFTVPGLVHWVCSHCDTSMCGDSQLTRNALTIAQFEETLPSYISPEKIVALREKYGITQAEAGKIFGGGPRAFSKYERGEVTPSASAATTLKRAFNEPEFFADLVTRQSGSAPKNLAATGQKALGAYSSALSISAGTRERVVQYAKERHVDLPTAVEQLLSSALDAYRQRLLVEAGGVRRNTHASFHTMSVGIDHLHIEPHSYLREIDPWIFSKPSEVVPQKFVGTVSSPRHRLQEINNLVLSKRVTSQRHTKREDKKYAYR